MPSKSKPPGPPSGTGRPTPREAVSRAQAAAGPAMARAQAKAGPKVEQAAAKAGTLLGTLRERAKETARGFTEGYGAAGTDKPADKDDKPGNAGASSHEQGGSPSASDQSAKPSPRPRPKPN